MTEFWANLSKNKRKSSTKKFLTAIEDAKEWKSKFDSMQVSSTIDLNSDDEIELDVSSKKRERTIKSSVEDDIMPSNDDDDDDDILEITSKRMKNDDDSNDEIKFKEIVDEINDESQDNHHIEEVTENIVPSSLNSIRSNEEEYVDPFAPTQPYHNEHDHIADYEAPTQPLLAPTQELLSTPLGKGNNNNNGGNREFISDVQIEKIVKMLKFDLEKSLQEKINELFDKINNSIDKKIEILEKSMKNLFNNTSKTLNDSLEQNIRTILKKEREFNLNIMHKSFQDCETLFNTLHKNISLLKEYDYKK